MFSNLPRYLANARKAIINVTGLGASLLALGLLPDPEAAWVAGGVSFLTVVSHYLTPNADAPGTTGASEDFDPTEDDEDNSVTDDFQPNADLVPPPTVKTTSEGVSVEDATVIQPSPAPSTS